MAGELPKRPVCALCTSPSRYKCPRCAAPTCSLPCSRRHKQHTGCTGERDKAQYVPMSAYGWGTMMRDYCYLEDIGRKAGEWGNEIVRGGYMANVGASKAASARRSPSGRKPTTGASKRDLLRDHLEAIGVDVEFLPAGMERRNRNQSTFVQKSRSSLLTIEFIFYPPSTLTSPQRPSYKILSHRNALSATLLSVLQLQASLISSKSQKQREHIPDWLLSTVIHNPEAPERFVPPHCYMCADSEFLHPLHTAYYYNLDPALSIGELLWKTSFIEFPTIHVFDPNAPSFFGMVIDKFGAPIRVSEHDRTSIVREAKRRKLSETVGPEAVLSLVGEYASDAGSPSEEDTKCKHQTGLATLEAYSSDVQGPSTDTEEDQSDSDADGRTEGDQRNPAKLLELVKQAQGAADQDVLDWRDEWDADTRE